ncbi:MAG: S-methyl-5'-thioadenosine phosphorylase [Candidatus Aenigmarchaeota archaeon]|nr:S-methyl-5'-thioadenosine phosphorylase [Candidatus Aenigmarchaeota archaeon]
MHMDNADIAIIGGTGFYGSDLLENFREIEISTPYGKPSDSITIGDFNGLKIAFLPRHGKKHSITPHRINFRANMWALKQLGVKRIITPDAVGSLQENIRPGEFLIPDQFIDLTNSRNNTFYDEGKVAHISMAEPFCPELSRIVFESGKNLGYEMHDKGTVVVIQGPRFSSKAESKLYRSWDAQIINMEVSTECTLAREAEICYAYIGMITDYDTFADKTVNVTDVMEILKQNSNNAHDLIKDAIPKIPQKRGCACGDALKDAMV